MIYLGEKLANVGVWFCIFCTWSIHNFSCRKPIIYWSFWL